MPYYGTMEMSLHCCEVAGVAAAARARHRATPTRHRGSQRASQGWRRRTEDLIYCEDLWLRVFK